MDMNKIYNQSKMIERRRILRRNQTATEKQLWKQLRGSKLGARFVRQFSIGCYVVDFYAPSRRLVVEIDGSIHELGNIKEYDLDRQANLESLGLHMLRFTVNEIVGNMNDVLSAIRSALQNPLLTKERAG